MTSHPFRLLRAALWADALASGALGLVMLAAAGLLGPWLGLPAEALRVTGLLFIPWVLACAYAASRPEPPMRLAAAIAALNGLYVLASLALPFTGIAPLTTVGTFMVLAQGVAVLLLAELQMLALWRLRRAGLATA